MAPTDKVHEHSKECNCHPPAPEAIELVGGPHGGVYNLVVWTSLKAGTLGKFRTKRFSRAIPSAGRIQGGFYKVHSGPFQTNKEAQAAKTSL